VALCVTNVVDHEELPADTEPHKARWGEGLVRTSQFIAVGLPLGAAVSYGTLHLAYGEALNGLGVKPEDVGLGLAEVLSTSLTAVLYALSYWVFYLALFLTPLVLALASETSPPPTGHAEKRGFRGRLGTLALTAAGAGWMSLLAYDIWRRASLPNNLKFVCCVLALLFLVVRLGAPLGRPRSLLKPLQEATPSTLFWLAVLGTFVGATWTTYHQVHRLALKYERQVLQGVPVSSVTLDLPGNPQAFDLRADAARIEWPNGAPSDVRRGDCLLFLGNGGGTDFIFDARTHETLRVSPTLVGTGGTIDKTRCPEAERP
jgi:hypothetical protein